MQPIDEAIIANKGLVYKQLHKFGLIDDPEAESIAYEALYNAIVSYDPNRGAKLSTAATVFIYNALGSYVRSLNCKRQIQTISYNTPLFSDESHEHLDMFASKESIEDTYIHKEVCSIAITTYMEMCDKLTNEKHKQILVAWKDSEFQATTVELAELAQVSQSYASQVINNFKQRLKKKLEDVYYD